MARAGGLGVAHFCWESSLGATTWKAESSLSVPCEEPWAEQGRPGSSRIWCLMGWDSSLLWLWSRNRSCWRPMACSPCVQCSPALVLQTVPGLPHAEGQLCAAILLSCSSCPLQRAACIWHLIRWGVYKCISVWMDLLQNALSLHFSSHI